MQYRTRIGERDTQAHINYHCPCGCEAGLLYDRHRGPEHLGMCCCGRLLWVGTDAVAVVSEHYRSGLEYELETGMVTLPWNEKVQVTLATPTEALAVEKAKHEAGKTPRKVTDPVCRMMIDPDTAVATSTYQGSTYYFCSSGCRARFDKNPGQYVRSEGLLDRLRGR